MATKDILFEYKVVSKQETYDEEFGVSEFYVNLSKTSDNDFMCHNYVAFKPKTKEEFDTFRVGDKFIGSFIKV